MKRLDASLEDKRLLRQVRREGAALLRGIREMERKLAVLRRAEVNLMTGRNHV